MIVNKMITDKPSPQVLSDLLKALESCPELCKYLQNWMITKEKVKSTTQKFTEYFQRQATLIKGRDQVAKQNAANFRANPSQALEP